MGPAMLTLPQPARCKKSRRFMDCRIALWAWLLADMLLLLQVPGVQWPALRKGVSRELCNSVRSIYSSLSLVNTSGNARLRRIVFEPMAWKTPRFRVAQASSYDQLQPSTNADKLSESSSRPRISPRGRGSFHTSGKRLRAENMRGVEQLAMATSFI